MKSLSKVAGKSRQEEFEGTWSYSLCFPGYVVLYSAILLYCRHFCWGLWHHAYIAWYFPLTEPRERPTHHSHHAGIAAPSRKDNYSTVRDKDRLRANGEGLGTHREFDYKYHGQDRDRPRVTGDGPGPHRERDNRHYDHGAARDKDWGSGDFGRAGRSHKPRQDREKHVRVNSRPVNRQEPRGGLWTNLYECKKQQDLCTYSSALTFVVHLKEFGFAPYCN